ncbi:hypothetical protein [Methylomonas sp. MgM2]
MMNFDSVILYSIMLIVIAQFIWSKIKPPKVDNDLHHFSKSAKELGQHKYEKIIRLNQSFIDKNALEEYASLVRDATQSLSMYMDTTERTSDRQELERQAIYWMTWTKYYQKKFERLEQKYNFMIEDD